jgi:hypothetical protein
LFLIRAIRFNSWNKKEMNINRHNYEEFFLLYVDNELSAADRKAVDVFVQDNPDLKGELQMLQQTVVKADDIVLEKKDWLFMDEKASALQENLLLYADDELSITDKRSIEALLATDKTSQAEWNILRQTKLQPDMSVVFDDKRSLYRTEGSRVIGFKWWRVAAAAVLLGIGLWTGVSIYKNNFKTTEGPEGIAKDNIKAKEQNKEETPVNTIAEQQDQDKESAATPQNNNVASLQDNPKEKNTVKNDQQTEKNNRNIKKDDVQPEENIAVQNKNEKPSNNLPRPYFENINNDKRNVTASRNVTQETINSGKETIVAKANPVEAQPNPEEQTTIAAIPVVNKTTEDNNRYLDIDESKGKRTILGGILRKAKRMVERTTNIKTGEGVKVAGFEIALK